jgi:hypothetical protein
MLGRTVDDPWRRTRAWLVAALALTVVGCRKHAAEADEGGPPREAMVAALVSLAERVVAGDEAAVREGVVAPPGMSEPEVMDLVRYLIKRGGVTVEGARALGSLGRYGLLGRVFRMAGPDEAKKLQLDPASCYAIKHDKTEVMAHWDGKQFRFFRLDNIGLAFPKVPTPQ